MAYYPRIPGHRIFLSPLDPADAARCTGWMNDLAVTIRIGAAHRTFTEQAEREYLESKKGDDHFFGIVLREPQELIGTCGLFEVSLLHRTATVGIALGEARHRGQGLGTEALALVLGYGFQILNLHSVMLKTFAFNEGALKSYHKLGFREFGRRRECYRIDGRVFDEVFMELLAPEFTGRLDLNLGP